MADGESAAATELAKDATGRQLTCFVITGFGRKTDYATGRVLDLDKTFTQLVRPAFDRLGINCFRAIEANTTGSIDKLMYEWIYEADFVIADLSTLNANVFYELGVRHAQKPATTIIIAESVLMQKIPFDLSSFTIHQYEHGGDEISKDVQEHFVEHLVGLLEKLMENEAFEQKPAARSIDSPVYTFLRGITEPEFEWEKPLVAPTYVPPDKRDEEAPADDSLATTFAAAEAAKQNKEFEEAIRLFEKAIEDSTRGQKNKKPDLFLAQRLALVTYKHGERKSENGEMDPEVAKRALIDAQKILDTYCAPNLSTDPETLGLSGAINKRLHQLTGDEAYLEKAIHYYERGFYVKQDYYNGINVAFMYTERANLQEDDHRAIGYFGHGNMIRKRVAEICRGLMEDTAAFHKRGDKQWVYMSLAEAYQGLGEEKEEAHLQLQIEQEADEFGKHSYEEQKDKLAKAIAEYDQRFQSNGTPRAPTEDKAETERKDVVAARTRPDVSTDGGVITIDADVARDKTIKSVEVNCRIEYE